jgi:hypothetical protein
MSTAQDAYYNMLCNIGKACADHYYRYDSDATESMRFQLASDLAVDYKVTIKDSVPSDAVCAMRTRFAAAVRAIVGE